MVNYIVPGYANNFTMSNDLIFSTLLTFPIIDLYEALSSQLLQKNISRFTLYLFLHFMVVMKMYVICKLRLQ